LQTEIFKSEGYKKYVTQTDGSMDLLVNLSTLKKLSFTYVYNNTKIQKILAHQQKRELIFNVVEKVKEKILRWRAFTRTTLDPSKKALREPETTPGSPEKQSEDKREDDDDPAILRQTPRQKKKSKEKKQEESKKGGKKRAAFGDADEVIGGVDFKEEDQLIDLVKEKKDKKLPQEQVDELFEKLAIQFVKSKEAKLRRCARCYLCLQRTYVQQILFRNQKAELEEIVDE